MVSRDWELTCGLPSRLVLYRGAMLLLVVRGAQSDRVFFGIVATPTAKFLMVNFQVRSTPAILACPTIAPQHLEAKLLVPARTFNFK